MNNNARMILMIMAALCALGCNRSGKDAKAKISSRTENAETTCTSTVDVLSTAIARVTAAGVTLTNCLCQEPEKAIDVYRKIHDDISAFPPDTGEECAKAIVKNILSVPYEHLDHYKRAKSLREMWDIMSGIWWPGMRETDMWEMRLLRLYRMRDLVEFAQSETNKWTTRSFITGHSSYITYDSEYLEQILADWIESPYPPEKRWALSRNGMTEKDCAIVKAKLESFLGRPIRTCDEIRRASINKIKQWRLEEERRRGGPDVKIDIGGL